MKLLFNILLNVFKSYYFVIVPVALVIAGYGIFGVKGDGSYPEERNADPMQSLDKMIKGEVQGFSESKTLSD